jgi:hypothetical protein
MINHHVVYSKQILKKVLKGSHVLLTAESTVEQITSYYYKHRWHKSKGSRFSSIGNFASRKGLNPTIKTKLQNM